MGDLEIIEGYYVQTVDDLFFAVKGLVHPLDRIIGVLRYLPDPAGDRRRRLGPAGEGRAGGESGLGKSRRVREGHSSAVRWRTYRRVYHFGEQEEILAGCSSEYIAFDPVFGARLQGVPRNRLAAVFDPRAGLARLRRRTKLDPAAKDTLTMVELLRDKAAVPWAALGVSGSLLIDLHSPASDIDLVVYGERHARAVQLALRRLTAEPATGQIRPLDASGLAALYASRVKDTHMAFEDFVRHERRKVIQGSCCGREYFVRFVQSPAEAGEHYGDCTYRPAGRATVRARVVDDREALFTPCRYRVAGVEVLAGANVEDLTEIVSFRGRFCEQAWVGDTVVAAGKLEQVSDRDGQAHHRLLLGSQPADYMVSEEAK